MLFQFTKTAADNPSKIIVLLYSISLLPIFGKIFEKLFFGAIYCHLCDNDFLTIHQSVFHPGNSTINQLLAITHRIYNGFEEMPSKESKAVFLDLSKVFDRLWH